MSANNDTFDDEYKLFEDRFRGSESVIRQRLVVYLPLIAAVAIEHKNGRKALDLGSGRGEWLGLISENGWNAVGVEPNEIAQAARDLEAEIVRADGLAYLRDCNDCSFGLVTAFHVVEHLEINYLLQMLREVQRVLIPGGLLIMETPNPENLTVGSWSFHLDPTHKSPIPPGRLQYHAEAAGFLSPEIVRLNGIQAEQDLGPLSTVLSVLFGSGRDYAVLARTAGTNDDLFAAVIKNFVFQNTQPNPADIRALIELTKTADTAIEQQTKLISNFGELEIALHHKNRELADLYSSSSWKISKPLRMIGRPAKGLRSRFKRILRFISANIRGQLRTRPKLTAMSLSALSFFPSLKLRLKRFAEPDAPQSSVWTIDVDPQTLADWDKTTHLL